jgi:hypothetical protein
MDTRNFNKLYDDIRNPSDETDSYEQNPQEGSFNFGYRYQAPAMSEGMSGGAKDLRQYLMPQVAPTMGYYAPEYGVDISKGIGSFGRGMPAQISGYYGPEGDQYRATLSPRNQSLGYIGDNLNYGIQKSPNNIMFNVGARFADGGDVGYQYGGGAIGYSEGGLAPITAGMPIAPGYARGGYISQGQPVNTHLTTTIPPVRGPMSQGVETLFKRRYS